MELKRRKMLKTEYCMNAKQNDITVIQGYPIFMFSDYRCHRFSYGILLRGLP